MTESVFEAIKRLLGRLPARATAEWINPKAFIDALIHEGGSEERQGSLRELSSRLNAVEEAFLVAEVTPPKPIAMRLPCERCGTLHIDKGKFATHPHHTHTCQNKSCGLTWRPAKEHTVGVQFIPGFEDKEETPVPPASWPDPDKLRQNGWGSASGGILTSEGFGSQAHEIKPGTYRVTAKVVSVKSGDQISVSVTPRPPPKVPWRPEPNEHVIRISDGVPGRVTLGGTHSSGAESYFVEADDSRRIGWVTMWLRLDEIAPYVEKPRPIVEQSIWQYRDGWQGRVTKIWPACLGQKKKIIACGPIDGPAYEWPEDAFLRAFTWVSDP